MSTILFVDDHHTFRTVFAEILRGAGHTVLEAGTIADAEHLVERQSSAIDLLVVEAVLTTTNGLDVERRFQSSYPKIQVLFVSEQAAENLLEEGLLPGGAHFLRKPFGAEELIGKLQQLAEVGTSSQVSASTVEDGARRTSLNRSGQPPEGALEMPGRKKSSTAKAKSERRSGLQAAKHRKLTSSSGDVVTGDAARDIALRAGGQEPTGATRKRKISAAGGKHKKKQKLSKGSTRASQRAKTHKRVKHHAID